MKKYVYTAVVLGFIVLLLILIRQQEMPAATNIEITRKSSSGQSSPMTWNNKADAEMTESEPQDDLPSKAYKPKSLNVGSGGTTVLEIEHGLPKQLIDTPEMRHGVDYGLNGAITLLVVDSTGAPVPGATVRGAFFNQWMPKDKRRFEIGTDVDGRVALENKNTGFVNFSVEKEAYYASVFRYCFLKSGYNCAKDGRWLPWNPTVEVVLKERRNPTKMLVKDVDIKLPLKNADYGFDFWVGDLVAPDGNGKVADIRVKCWGDKPYPPSRNFTNELLVVSASVGGGFVVKAKDKWSEFPSDYEAPENGYSESFHLSMKRSEIKIFENVELAETDYLIVKIVRGKAGGNGAGSWYGKIYGPLIYGIMTNDREGAGVKFSYYLNLTPDDRNLEAEGRYP